MEKGLGAFVVGFSVAVILTGIILLILAGAFSVNDYQLYPYYHVTTEVLTGVGTSLVTLFTIVGALGVFSWWGDNA